MSLKEGMRRLALLLGAVGAIFGGFASWSELQSIKEQRASHDRFEQLAASPVAQQARRSIDLACAKDPSDKQCGDANYNPMSEINSGGIKTIYWSKKNSLGKINYQAGLIQTDDGQNFISTTPAPSAWEYLLTALFPILGFFIAWGAVCAIGWVGAGFVASGK